MTMLRGLVVMAALVAACFAGCNTHVDEQRLAIGNPCNTSGQCGTGKFFCDTTHPNGYCKAMCSQAPIARAARSASAPA